MAIAALTPRVRIMAVCDRVRESKTEPGVFDLRNVRQMIYASAFPFVPSQLWLYLLLSSPRPGEHAGYILVRHSKVESDKTMFRSRMSPNPRFEEDSDFLPLRVRIRCSFPEPGRYIIQACFFQEMGSDVLKGELPFDVFQEGA
jgi:hypothetical protein